MVAAPASAAPADAAPSGIDAASTNAVDVLRARGFVAQVSDEDALRRAFDSGRVTLYQGFDPTATSLHAGTWSASWRWPTSSVQATVPSPWSAAAPA